MILIEIPGTPIPLKRPRFSTRSSKPIAFDSQKVEKDQYKWQIRSQFRNNPFKCPIHLDIHFFMPIPKSASKIRRKEMKANMIQHMIRPDIDNLAKFVLDCLNGLVFDDDSQVFSMKIQKSYSDNPATIINIDPKVHSREKEDATQERNIQEGSVRQYSDRDFVWKTPTTSRRDRIIRGTSFGS